MLRHRRRAGRGLIDKLINVLPFELHIPGYRYCGPGTRLQERLARNEAGINPLDEACKEHDIAYHQHKDLGLRHQADRVLASKAWDRFKNKDTPLGEKTAAYLVTTAMNAKVKMGSGARRKRRVRGSRKTRRVAGKGMTFNSIVKHARNAIRKNPQNKSVRHAAASALKAARNFRKGKSLKRLGTRTLPLPKTGGVLPLVPIFSALSALGSLAGGVTGVAKAIAETKDARKRLAETQRHNQAMEAIALKHGTGLFLKPYKRGLGLYMTPFVKHAKN